MVTRHTLLRELQQLDEDARAILPELQNRSEAHRDIVENIRDRHDELDQRGTEYMAAIRDEDDDSVTSEEIQTYNRESRDIRRELQATDERMDEFERVFNQISETLGWIIDTERALLDEWDDVDPEEIEAGVQEHRRRLESIEL